MPPFMCLVLQRERKLIQPVFLPTIIWTRLLDLFV